MNNYVVSFGVARRAYLGDEADDDHSKRTHALVAAAFALGPAWHGGQKAIFLRSDLSIDEVIARFVQLLQPSDLALVVQTAPERAVRYCGMRFDEEGFDAVFPDAIEIMPWVRGFAKPD
jgi:hypothetical protein